MDASVRTTELGRKAITFRRMKCIITASQPEVILPFWTASFQTTESSSWILECSTRGRSILCVCLGDGEQTRWNRNDFIGVLKDEFLPDWAKESLKQYQRPEQTEKQEMQMGGM